MREPFKWRRHHRRRSGKEVASAAISLPEVGVAPAAQGKRYQKQVITLGYHSQGEIPNFLQLTLFIK